MFEEVDELSVQCRKLSARRPSVSRASYILLIAPLAALSFLASFVFDTISVSDAIEQRLAYSMPQPSSFSTSLPTAEEDEMPSRHFLFALAGNRSGFMSEFEVALKSVLLNAPPNNTTIHIMANGPAYDALDTILYKKAQLPTWVTPFPLQVVVYNVENQQEKWWDLIQKRMAAAAEYSSSSLLRHTLGAYYRLLCGEVLPSTVDRVLYLDTDVVMLANPEYLWQTHIQDKALFQWGREQCSGFMLLRPHKMEQLWILFDQVPNDTLKELVFDRNLFVDDQLVFHAVNQTFPDAAGTLPAEFDISAVNGPWMKNPTTLLWHRPDKAGMLHFNGGGASKQAYFHSHAFLRKPLWGDLARYYVAMPWTWARFIVASSVRQGQGEELSVQFRAG